MAEGGELAVACTNTVAGIVLRQHGVAADRGPGFGAQRGDPQGGVDVRAQDAGPQERLERRQPRAIITLVLALTDQFGGTSGVGNGEARALLGRIHDSYERAYYEGMICERWANAALRDHKSETEVWSWFADALALYERAEKLAQPGNEDAVLRWNACVRVLQAHPSVCPATDDMLYEDFMDSIPPA